jgi:hypothetical protein
MGEGGLGFVLRSQVVVRNFIILEFSLYVECGHSSFLVLVFFAGGEVDFQRV